MKGREKKGGDVSSSSLPAASRFRIETTGERRRTVHATTASYLLAGPPPDGEEDGTERSPSEFPHPLVPVHVDDMCR